MDTKYKNNDEIKWKGIHGKIVKVTKKFYNIEVLNDDAPYDAKGHVCQVYQTWINADATAA